MHDQIFAVLDRWTNLRVESLGHFWLIAGTDPFGVSRCGSRQDGLSLAADLRDIAERENVQFICGPEPSNPAPPDAAPSVADASPAAAVTEGASAYPGLFLQRDDEARLRADVIAAISMRKRALIEAIDYGSGLLEELTAFSQYNNARAISQEIPQSTIDLAEAYMRRTAREQAIRDYADRLESAAIGAGLPMLQAMIDTYQEGWP